MGQEILDFEELNNISNYEKFLNALEAIPSFLKLICILFFSLFSGLIICYKANSAQDPIPEILITTGGFFILLMAVGLLSYIVLTIICAFFMTYTKFKPKIGRLGMLSVIFIFALLSFVTISILAIFIPS